MWALGTRSQRRKPVSLAWRPDGQGIDTCDFSQVGTSRSLILSLVLAVTFSNRSVVLASVQDGHTLSSEALPFEIRSCSWVERIQPVQEETNPTQFVSKSIDAYLPVLVDLSSVNRARKHVIDPPDDLFSLDKQSKLNM